jgi:uncharacterized protein YbjT (DUF2867 family)
MKILLTGASGYIGKRLLPVLVNMGYDVVCGVRDTKRFTPPKSIRTKVSIIQLDLLEKETLKNIPRDINAAFYLVHSMSSSSDYHALEEECAINFTKELNHLQVEHVVYLSGIINESELSKHLSSRKNVELELRKGDYNLTTLRAGIIVGSGSASFEIMRDLVEKLPIMITPKWLNTKCQPIGISDVMLILSKTVLNTNTYNQDFDIGGKDILSYKEMLLEFGKKRNLKRFIFVVPVMTPKLSSYWLYFVTSTSYKLAVALVNSMKIEVVCRNNSINKILNIAPISYAESLEKAFSKIQRNEVASSWKDAYISSNFKSHTITSDFIKVPSFGCYIDNRKKIYIDREKCLDKIWSIGGENGWYYANWLWKLRGFLDKLSGGVGLRRGRTSLDTLNNGDALDFWRVLYADKQEGRLILFAEMKLPGEAWLEFRILKDKLKLTATFRPLGLLGRLYWFSVLPFHGFIFEGMINKLVRD